MYMYSSLINGIFTLVVIIGIIAFIAWLIAIQLLIDVYKKKADPNPNFSTGLLWFIGIFASPIVLGLYVCAVSNNKISPEESQKQIKSQLPNV